MLKKFFLPVMSGCLMILTTLPLFAVPSEGDNFHEKYYNLWFELDPENKVFRSDQKITLTNAAKENLSYMAFALDPTLIIDHINVTDAQGSDLGIKNRKESPVKMFNQYDFKEFSFETAKQIKAGTDVILHLKYHLDPQYIYREVPENIYGLVISPWASYAIAPLTGHYPRFGAPSAPYEVRIKYPEDHLSCVPGDLVSFKKEKGFRIDTYRCRIRNIPTFACARYIKKERKKEGFSVEFYTFPGQSIEEDLVENTFKIVDLLFKYFGDNGTTSYKFAVVGRLNHPVGGGESKGNTIYYADATMNGYAQNKQNILAFVAHEVFHNWNLWSIYWDGKLGEWFGEGGANFIGAWAVEKLLGLEAAGSVRKGYVNDFINRQGYKSGQNLEQVTKTGQPERALMYSYGALVWEQLRQKMGEKNFLAALGEFFRTHGFKKVTADTFFSALKAKSGMDMEEYIAPWTRNNAAVDLLISDVQTQKHGDSYSTQVVVEVAAKRDCPILTQLGYQLPGEASLKFMDVSLNKKGKHIFTIKTKKRPVNLQIDPFFRVPQVNIANNTRQVN